MSIQAIPFFYATYRLKNNLLFLFFIASPVSSCFLGILRQLS